MSASAARWMRRSMFRIASSRTTSSPLSPSAAGADAGSGDASSCRVVDPLSGAFAIIIQLLPISTTWPGGMGVG